MVLYLTAPYDGWNKEEFNSVMSGWPFYKSIEAAGSAHLELVTERSMGIYSNYTKEENNDQDQEKEEKKEENNKQENKDNKSGDSIKEKFANRTRKKKTTEKEKDYYEILGLGHLRWGATDKDIKKSYRKLILSHHPDKQAQSSSEVDDEVFKSLNKAYECLSNPEKRRAYDSKDEFDDRIPTENHAQAGDFFCIFSPVFERNSKWSVDKNIPSLGNNDTSIEDTHKFYDFWRNFKSWREFSAGEDEFDLDEAESREEKRWMDRQNKKVTNKKKKEDYARIMLLVNTAFKYDPRIIKWKEEQEKERLRKIEQRKAFKRNKREAKEKAEREAKEKIEREKKEKEEREQNAKKNQIAENKQIRKKRPQLRKICRKAREDHEINESLHPFYPREDHVELLCKFMNLKQFNDVLKAFTNDTNGPYVFRDMLIVFKIITEDDPYFKQVENTSVTNSSSELNNQQEPKEIKKEEEKKKEIENKVKVEEQENKNNEWTNDEITLLTKGLAKYPVGTRDRYNLVSELIGTRTVKEVIAQTKIGKQETAQDTNLTKQDAFSRFKETKKDIKKPIDDTPTIIPPSNPVKNDIKQKSEQCEDPSAWSPEEQKLLENAIKKYSAKETDRWNKIATEMPNRNKKECIQRYKYLVEFFKQQKAEKRRKKCRKEKKNCWKNRIRKYITESKR